MTKSVRTKNPGPHVPYLQKAVEICGSQHRLARAVQRSQQLISYYLTAGKLPAELAVDIETATNKQVTRHQLRPDLFADAGSDAR